MSPLPGEEMKETLVTRGGVTRPPSTLLPTVGADFRVRQVGIGHAVGGRDGSAVELQRVGRDADPVVIPVARLHGVVEVQRVTTPAIVGCVARLRPDGERHLGFAGRLHRAIEFDYHLDHLPEFVGVTPRREGDEGDRFDHRDRDQATVHLSAVLPGAFRRMRQVGGGGAVRVRDGSAVEGQRVGRDGDPVLVSVTLLHRVAEVLRVIGLIDGTLIE